MNKVLLCILDGWGIGDGTLSDAVSNAHTPIFDLLKQNYSHSELITFGEAVGLPEGQMGNSEVGHLTIGSGRVVYQDLVRINKAVETGELTNNPALKTAFSLAAAPGRKLHLMGLVSDGGVHSSQHHLHHLCDLATAAGLRNVFIHAFTDGRDTDPKSGLGYMQKLENHISGTPVRIASVSGRYYSMDRDKRWERIRLAYETLVNGKGVMAVDPCSAIEASYKEGVTDEFIRPTVITQPDGSPLACISPGDVVICFNFRTDRCREITEVLTQHDMPESGMNTIPLHYVTMTRYDEKYRNVHVIFHNQNLSNTLGEIVSAHGLTQLRIAETEKYPHVTFFFNGGRENPFTGETRILVKSPPVATYDLQPEMSAPEVTDRVIQYMNEHLPDLICLNFANPDMVGHTGVYDAIIKAVECVDKCLGRIIEAAEKAGYTMLVIADHGNADYVINKDGSPNTAHTMNPVPVILADKKHRVINSGTLSDIAPTILELMGIEKPAEMSGRSLIRN